MTTRNVREAVILVHGLWMHGIVMTLMRRRLEQCGYTVHAFSYPSVRLSLTENSQRLARYCRTHDHAKLHFVGHSLGGLVALAAAHAIPPQRRGRIVLIGTPFADTFSGRQLERLPGGRRLLGKCVAEWLQTSGNHALHNFEIGVIAGSGGIGMGRVIAPRLPKPHDGVISVHETRVPGMCEHITLPVSHTQMLVSAEVVRQTCAFLRQGRFDRAAENAA